MTKMIKVHDNVYKDLTDIKRDDRETYSEVIFRLIKLFHILQEVKAEDKLVGIKND